jgi:LacI family transcriptional regulator
MASLQPPSKNDDATAPDRARRAPTIDDVAALAGVGRATVSRALNDQANVSAKVRARVMHAVATLDYKVNPQARSLASRSGNALTLVNCNSLDAPPNSFYFAAIELGALRAAAAAGLELSTFNVYVEDQRRHDKVIDLFRSGRTAGLVLSPPLSADTALAARLIEHHCPVVCISPSEEVRAMLPSVGFDEEAAGYEIAHHVVAAGHRRFGYLLGIEGHLAAESRFAGFMRALGEVGLGAEAVTVLRGDFSFKSGVELADTLLDSPEPATAIVCANDDMAVGVMFAAHRLGLDMPLDLSVVGFDDAPVAAYIWPPLTTIHQPIRRIAARAIERLAEALRRGQGPVSAGFDAIEHHIVLRESVAAPRG